MSKPEKILSREIYREYEIIYHDQGDDPDDIGIMETTSLTSEKEARRIADAWQRSCWTPGRRFSYRELNPKTKTLDDADPSAIMAPHAT